MNRRIHMFIPFRKLIGPSARALAAVLASALLLCGTNKGPDGASYMATDATVYSFIDLTAGGNSASVLAGADDDVALLTLPFPFQFYGNSYTLLCVSSNGVASFVTAAAACTAQNDFANTDLTATAPPGDLPSILPIGPTSLSRRPARARSITLPRVPQAAANSSCNGTMSSSRALRYR